MTREGLPRRDRDGAHVRRAARQRPDLELRRQRLADGRAAVRTSTCSPGTPTRRACRRGCTASTCASATSRTGSARGDDATARPRASASTWSRSTSTTSSAEDDHITPWKGCYASSQLFTGRRPVRPQLVGPHRRHRQPTGRAAHASAPTGGDTGRRRRSGSRRRPCTRGHVVEGLGALDAAARGSATAAADDGERRLPAARARPRARTCSNAELALLDVSSIAYYSAHTAVATQREEHP